MKYTRSDVCIITTVNNETILENCLYASPDVKNDRVPVTVLRDAKSMAGAYNAGLSLTTQRLCVFVHQDVYFPEGWLTQLLEVANHLEELDPAWMVFGPYGVMKDGTHIGRVWDVNMGRELGSSGFAPTPVESLDELVLVVKREDDFRFDENLPSFHLYGTDLVQSAWALGRSSWAVELPVVHNNRPWSSLGGGYADAYNYVRRKWRNRLPISSTVCRITDNPFALWRVRWRRRKIAERGDILITNSVETAIKAGYQER